jgi:hypothetical protein
MVESSGRLSLPEVIRTSGKGLRPKVRTVTEGIHLIDQELPIELRSLRRWTFAGELLTENRWAERIGLIASVKMRQAASSGPSGQRDGKIRSSCPRG